MNFHLRPSLLHAAILIAVIFVGAGCGGAESETFSVTGTLLLIDEIPIAVEGSSCSGSGGYSDVASSTPVIVEALNRDVITRTSLGRGTVVDPEVVVQLVGGEFTVEQLRSALGRKDICFFEFSFDLVAGSDAGDGYVVKVGDRGESFLSEAEIQEPNAMVFNLGL